jgi:putative membrane protein
MPWIIWPLIMLVVFIACMTMMMRRKPDHGDGHALTILRERYARGEISTAEYEERRRLLGA